MATTPKGAYGLFKLLSDYQGSLVRLVRASDSAQLDFGFLANGFLDAATVTAWIGGSTAKVVTWYDQSGNGNHLTQATDADRPSYSTAIGFPDSRPAVKFVRSNSLNGTLLTCADSGQFDFSGDLTIVFVWEPNAINVGVQTLMSKSNGGLAGEFAFNLENTTGKLYLDRPFIEAGTRTTTGTTVGVANVHAVEVNGTAVLHRLNGADNGTDTLATGTATATILQVGAGNFAAGTQQDPIRGYMEALMLWDSYEPTARAAAELMMINRNPAGAMTAGSTTLNRRRRRARFRVGRRRVR